LEGEFLPHWRRKFPQFGGVGGVGGGNSPSLEGEFPFVGGGIPPRWRGNFPSCIVSLQYNYM